MKKLIIFLFFFFYFEYSFAENKIAYIDINNILNNSIVGKSISAHINNIKEKKNKEFAILQSQLIKKEEDIIKKKNIIEKNEFEKQVDDLKKEIDDYSIQRKNFDREVEEKKIKYTKIVLNSLNKIISKYVEENSISLVFPKKNIIIAKKNLDITTSIMELLNKELKQINF
tara:strand:- start:787 stop:1299 length:513 start_codon:yes stop_codon:yes gene_type:complete